MGDFLVRITGGSANGRVIIGPKGKAIRPTASKTRQAFFNIVGNKIKGARFLDLCAGTGLMGLEALSRGASHLTAIEEHRPTAKTIETNVEKLDFEAEIVCADAAKILPRLKAQFDIIYADPPYKSHLVEALPALIEKAQVLDRKGVLAIEHTDHLELPESSGDLNKFDQRKYGQTIISFYHFAKK